MQHFCKQKGKSPCFIQKQVRTCFNEISIYAYRGPSSANFSLLFLFRLNNTFGFMSSTTSAVFPVSLKLVLQYVTKPSPTQFLNFCSNPRALTPPSCMAYPPSSPVIVLLCYGWYKVAVYNTLCVSVCVKSLTPVYVVYPNPLIRPIWASCAGKQSSVEITPLLVLCTKTPVSVSMDPANKVLQLVLGTCVCLNNESLLNFTWHASCKGLNSSWLCKVHSSCQMLSYGNILFDYIQAHSFASSSRTISSLIMLNCITSWLGCESYRMAPEIAAYASWSCIRSDSVSR